VKGATSSALTIFRLKAEATRGVDNIFRLKAEDHEGASFRTRRFRLQAKDGP
jgi:hypothetical protein